MNTKQRAFLIRAITEYESKNCSISDEFLLEIIYEVVKDI